MAREPSLSFLITTVTKPLVIYWEDPTGASLHTSGLSTDCPTSTAHTKIVFKNRRGAANPGSANRSANCSISAPLSEKPFSHLAAQTRAPATEAFYRAHPGRYKSTRCCQEKRYARRSVSIILQARLALLLVCPTSPKHNRVARWVGN